MPRVPIFAGRPDFRIKCPRPDVTPVRCTELLASGQVVFARESPWFTVDVAKYSVL